MSDNLYIHAKKNLKKTNTLINDFFIKQQEKEVNYTRPSDSSIDSNNEINIKKLNQIEKKLDLLLDQNKNLKKINLILLNTLKDNCEEIKNLIDYTDLDDSNYIPSINDVEI